MDYELLLFDRLNMIRDTINKYGKDNFYLSFSGGKDSTILHYLLDMALPNNNIPRVYIDTGIDYNLIKEFVLKMAKEDGRFTIIKPTKPIKQMLETVGYPFKSKIFAYVMGVHQRLGKTKGVKAFLGEETTKKGKTKTGQFKCPTKLLPMFEENLPFKISDRCCWEMKKKPAQKYEEESGRHIALTGMRKDEGGGRMKLSCVITDKKGNVKRFHPLLVVDEEWENRFVKENNIELCPLYNEPYNFRRTGCKGCPFALDLQQCLETMEKYFPNERKQCEIIWKPVYEKYRELNYRLKKVEKVKLL